MDSYNAVVLLTGQVASTALRDLAGRTVAKMHSVGQVHNEVKVQQHRPMLRRTKDSWLGTKVKTKLLANRDVEGRRIRVSTADGAVYLMGLVSRAEAARVTESVRHTRGANKVVRVFEYID